LVTLGPFPIYRNDRHRPINTMNALQPMELSGALPLVGLDEAIRRWPSPRYVPCLCSRLGSPASILRGGTRSLRPRPRYYRVSDGRLEPNLLTAYPMRRRWIGRGLISSDNLLEATRLKQIERVVASARQLWSGVARSVSSCWRNDCAVCSQTRLQKSTEARPARGSCGRLRGPQLFQCQMVLSPTGEYSLSTVWIRYYGV
jgi:hypothetical protein